MADDSVENEDEWSPVRFREDEEMDFFTELALHEAERWIQAVTRKKFEYPEDFRKSLSNGVLLCELLNNLKPGSVKRINKLPGAIAGLDNLNVFLSACEKNFGLNKTQLFDPNDLEDLSTRAISDDADTPGSEYLFKQEVDRRARNVAVTVYWLGKSVANKYKGPTLDASAFGALVHSHGNKDIISDECFRNGNSLNKDDSIDTSSNKHRHVRDSSYDSLGSYERESESSFDELDGGSNNMPVRSDMREMRRYGSASSLTMHRDLRLSTASGESAFSDNKDDSLYQSSPDLSHGSQVHTRSSSTDSAEGNYYGNHSRQSSGSTDYPTRRLSSSTSGRKTSTSTPDPLQFVKLKGADNLALQAKKQIEATKEVNIMRGKIDSTSSVSEEPDWQSNFNNWKSKRRKSAYARLSDDLDEEPEKRTSQKTFSQIMAEKENRRSLGAMNFYPLEDDDSGIGVKQETMTKSSSNNNESQPKAKKSTKGETAPWAQGSSGDENNSQSDSETNNSHQSCDTDSVFSDKSTPSKILSDDDSWVKKTNAQAVSNKLAGHVKTQKPIGESRKLWENNVNESQKKDDRKPRDLPTNSVKIKSLTQSYEQKEKDANTAPVVTRRSEFNRSSLTKSLDLSDHTYSTPLSPVDKKPPSPLSPNAPKALLPKGQRYSQSERSSKQQTPTKNNANRKFVEKTIKINQKPNNEKGFGFFLTGGAEKRLPITVQRVSLGSAADVCEVEANDELISINGRDVSNLAFAQVQGIVDHSIKRGEIVLKIKRYTDEDGYDSMEDSLSPSNKPSNNNNNNVLDNKPDTYNNRNHYQDINDSGSFKPSFELSAHTDDRPRLMDQLIQEQNRETNNKQEVKPPSPVPAESFTAEVSFNTKSVPKNEVTPPPQQTVTHPPQMVTPPRPTERNQDLSGPDDVTLTEEKQTISVKPTPEKTEPLEEPVVMRRSRPHLHQESPQPPTPPKSELPQLSKMGESPGRTLNDTPGRTVSVDASGFGPPAALMRWQRPRPKSEYHSSYTKPSENTYDKNKRLSSTLPYNSESPFSLGNDFSKDYSKDDSMLDKVNNDFMESVSISKPVESKPTRYQFNDTSRIEEWQQKQEQQRMPETEQPRAPSFEVSIRADDNLTAQSAAPTRKLGQVEAPYVVDLGIPADDPEMSTEEKFERNQQKIRQQYEEEKKRAKEAERLKQEQEAKALNSDKFLRDMEAQIVQTKQEVTNPTPSYNEPIRTLGTEQRYSSEPMTIKLPSNSPGRPLLIDPRNQSNDSDSNIPEYSFCVELPMVQSAPPPPLRTLNPSGPTQQEILEQERAKIREEEKRKFEEERQKWKEEQERELRLQQEKIQQERENLLREQKRVEQEKAMLERSKHDDYNYTPSNNHLYVNPKTSSGHTSLSPKSPPALDPKYKKAPPPTAPKPDKAGNKARLTREDLLAMNRKATPLTKPDFPEGYSPESGSLSPTTREAPSKGELHSLNAVPKQKFRSSAAWIKEEEEAQNAMNERPFVIGNRSDLIHTRDNSNPSEHWVVREAEKRRLAEKNDRYGNSESVTAHAGPTKPSQSSLVSRFRGDIEPQPRSNRYSYPSTYSSESRLSPTSRGSSSSNNNLYNRNMEPGITQFSAKTQPNTYASNPSLSQTLPPSFSFNANVRNQDGGSVAKPPRSLSDDSGPVIAVSGKQKCSHCGEELGFGAAMVIESLGLYYHVQCFRCCVCRIPLGNGSEGTDVRVRVNKLHCKNCYSNDEEGLKFSKV